jgi:hypothetical protein
MAITYQFTEIKVEIAPQLGDLQDVITRARYVYVGTDENGIKGEFPGATPMPPPGDANFIPFNEVTEPEVVAWLEQVADLPHMQQQITKKIEAQINPMYVPVPNPWDPTTTSTTSTTTTAPTSTSTTTTIAE